MNPYIGTLLDDCSPANKEPMYGLFLLNLNVVGMWFGEDQQENLIKHMFKKDWTTSSNLDNYPTLDSEHNLKDMCIQLRNQQTCIFDNHN